MKKDYYYFSLAQFTLKIHKVFKKRNYWIPTDTLFPDHSKEVQRHLLTFLKLSSSLPPLFSPSNSYPFHPPYPISLYLFPFVTERRAVAVVVMATK
jgi:hypothetical protein